MIIDTLMWTLPNRRRFGIWFFSDLVIKNSTPKECTVLPGTVYWITGLSGSGKTTVGKKLYSVIRDIKSNVVLLDGDDLRNVFGNDLGYTFEDRHKSAMRNANISRFLALQGLDFICCTISMFDDVRKWNRENIPNYIEVFLKVSDEILFERNQKNLYVTSKDNLVGFGVTMEEPKNPDLIITNDGKISVEKIVQQITELANKEVLKNDERN